jgi:hypothetical protein
MWKDRSAFPIVAKLEHYKFDSVQLLADYLYMAQQQNFNALMSEYDGLCKTHNKLPQFFIEGDSCPDEHASYSQLALSEWDQNFDLSKRTQLSETMWDRLHPKRKSIADERFYRKPIDNIPSYLASVLDAFRPALHRCRFAKLNAKSEVRPHIDYDTTYGIRLHIAIKTNQNCVNGGLDKKGHIQIQHIPADGSIWFVNQGVKHWAKNEGDSDRVHLIMSLDSQKFIEHLAN